MFEHHKKSPWFAEKYEPSEYYVNLRKRVKKQGWRGKVDQFLLELEEGKHDPQIELKDEGLHISGDDFGQKQLTDMKQEIVKSVDLKNGPQEDDMQFGLDGEEDHDHENKIELTSKSAIDAKASSRNDEISVMPEGNEILIRTIPPDIGRVKLEEVSIISIFVPYYSYACKGLLKYPRICALGLGGSVPQKAFL